MPDEKKLNVAIYCRLAHKEEDSRGVEAQRRLIRDFAAQKGFTNCLEYIDNGASGITLDRPAFARMNEDIQKGRIQVVLARNIARLCRDACLLHTWLQSAEERGVAVFTVQDGNVADVMSPLRQMWQSVSEQRQNQ